MNKYQVEIGEEAVELVEGASLSEALQTACESNNLNTQRLVFVGIMSLLAEVEDTKAKKQTRLRLVKQEEPTPPCSRLNYGIRRVNGRLDRKVTLVTDGASVNVWATNSGGCVGRFDEQGVKLYSYAPQGQGPLIASINRKPTYSDWVAFRDCIETAHDVAIPQGFLPYWLNN